MELSIVVVAYNIPRELPRTLLTLATGYQRDVSEHDYEVIVVDNGSVPAVDETVFAGLDGRFRLVRIDDAPPSPYHAANVGLNAAEGDVIAVLIDGARMVSPGFIHRALTASRMHPQPAIVTLGWYIGFDFQQMALHSGWTKADEDALLQTIDWPGDGYRLFEIATMDESSVNGWFAPIFESNVLFLPRATWKSLGGFDEKFDAPGGGLVNHDVLRRATEIPGLDWMILSGEATFHQLHYGISSNASLAQHVERMHQWNDQYRHIRQREIELVELPSPSLVGPVPPPLRPRFTYAQSVVSYDKKEQGQSEGSLVPPVPLPDPSREQHPIGAQWLDLARRVAQEGRPIEAMTYARWGREIGSDIGTAGPLLACVAADTSVDRLPAEAFARFHADAGLLCVDNNSFDNAAAHFAEALRVDPGNALARVGLTRMQMPGPMYDEVLRWIHAELAPVSYLEIGVAEGGTMAIAGPSTIAIGVDPEPAITQPIVAPHTIFSETSAEFFAKRDVRKLLGGAPSLVFIDGLHTLPAVLDDFLHVEAISDSRTLVVLHDTIPFDEITQRPERVQDFYTGDVWKLLHCLAEVRPDLTVATVRTAPSGLTLVSGLDRTSTVLRDRYDELVAHYGSLPFEAAANQPGEIIENRIEAVGAWLAKGRSRESTAANLLHKVGGAIKRR